MTRLSLRVMVGESAGSILEWRAVRPRLLGSATDTAASTGFRSVDSLEAVSS